MKSLSDDKTKASDLVDTALTDGQIRVLRTFWFPTQTTFKPLTREEIARRMKVKMPNVMSEGQRSVLWKLEEAGYIDRMRHRMDRLSQHGPVNIYTYNLTTKGKAVVRAQLFAEGGGR